ncbi:flagellar hook capping FlgD N-terminal domain-containing protein [Jeongeupia naejangsanensis]|uniref:Basal-body rod modification protein FlgD n=1 Tax=Jeongeupia naejangsanensis TaxID=613195 RepID=A0ABS2BGF7_9NEIS|nr:flagellar hook capping FlgD N-terminal domain-containing protein [Jeongeupia naejangsanensis]MBM3114702.1 flagellar basal body rod modification protein [Jeongeupia naejangsanensis]
METTLQTGLQGQGTTTQTIASAIDSGSMTDMFTKLLVAQVRNQDPLSPSDPSQFVSQLTQLSQVEAMQKMASQSAASTAALDNLTVLALGARVGSNVTATTKTVELNGTPVHGGFTLDGAAAKVEVVLTGADGVPHVVPLGSHGSGDVAFDIDPAKLGLKDGSYNIAVRTDTGKTPAVELNGVLQSVRVAAGGGAVLSVSGIGNVDVSAITGFSGPQA